MSQFSIVCAIEAGRLEAQTLLMLSTLNQFGGGLAQAPVVAFQGRTGEPLSKSSHKMLSEMGVEYVFRPELNRAPWFNYTNKIAAVQFAQEAFDTPWCIWLDSDILFLAPPSFADGTGLEDIDFHARFEFLSPALAEGEPRFADYWRRVVELCDVDFEAICFHDLDLPPKRMKPYFNSGFFLWRTETDFASEYARNFYRILAARIAPKGIGPWFADQVSLTPTVAALGLRWRMMQAEDHLMMFQNALEAPAFLDVMPRARVAHYSKSRNPPYRDIFDPLVLERQPALAGLFQRFDEFSTEKRAGTATHMRRYARRLRQAIYVLNCTDL